MAIAFTLLLLFFLFLRRFPSFILLLRRLCYVHSLIDYFETMDSIHYEKRSNIFKVLIN